MFPMEQILNLNQKCWLLFEKSDETRTSKGIDGYRDETGEIYRYDSLVPNYKNLNAGDVIVLRKEDEVLGLGRIENITSVAAVKDHRRCSRCQSTDIRERKTKSPRWECGACAHEFAEPVKSNVNVEAFTATICDFTRLKNPPTFQAVKACAAGGGGQSSQLSILQLDADKIKTLLEGVETFPSDQPQGKRASGQGFGLSPAERKAVELHAMRIARKIYEDEGWTVVDTSASRPFDLLATKGGLNRYVEVKGTTGSGQTIILTSGEVTHANHHPKESALVVVAQVKLNKNGDRWIAEGGTVCFRKDPWIIRASSLEPTQFKYIL